MCRHSRHFSGGTAAPPTLTITITACGDQRTIAAPSAPSAAPTAASPAAPPADPPAALTTTPDTHPALRETDLSHVVRLASTGQVEFIADSLMSMYRTTYTCNEMVSRIRSLFCLRGDVGLFLCERVLQSFMKVSHRTMSSRVCWISSSETSRRQRTATSSWVTMSPADLTPAFL